MDENCLVCGKAREDMNKCLNGDCPRAVCQECAGGLRAFWGCTDECRDAFTARRALEREAAKG